MDRTAKHGLLPIATLKCLYSLGCFAFLPTVTTAARLTQHTGMVRKPNPRGVRGSFGRLGKGLSWCFIAAGGKCQLWEGSQWGKSLKMDWVALGGGALLAMAGVQWRAAHCSLPQIEATLPQSPSSCRDLLALHASHFLEFGLMTKAALKWEDSKILSHFHCFLLSAIVRESKWWSRYSAQAWWSWSQWLWEMAGTLFTMLLWDL